MKKNVIKILLALVIVALTFAMVACGGTDDKKGTDTTPKDCGDGNHVDEDNDGKCDKCKKDMPAAADLSVELTKVLGKVGNYLTTLKNIKADSAIGLDVGVGAYYEKDKDAGNFKLSVKGNLSAKDPQAEIGVTLNGKSATDAGEDYFKLGYKGGNIYLAEALNKIDSSGSNVTANKIKMDVSGIKTGITSAAKEGMNALAYVAGLKTIQDFHVDSIVESLDSSGTDGSENMLVGLVKGIIDVESKDSATAFVITSTKINSILDTVMGFIDTDTQNKIDTVLDYADRVLGFSEKIFGLEKGEKLTLNKFTSDFLPGLKIQANYNGEDLESIDVALTIDSINLELGLNVRLAAFSAAKTVTVMSDASSYKAQDLKGSVNLNLGQRDLKGVLDVVVNTGTALAKDGNTVASAKLSITDVTKTTDDAVKAVFDGKNIYMDASKIFEELGKTVPADTKLTYQSAFEWKFHSNDHEETKVTYTAPSLVDAINHGLGTIKFTAPTSSDDSDDEDADKGSADTTGNSGIFTTIYNILAGKDNKWAGEKAATIDDVIVLLDKKIGSQHTNGSFLKFVLVDKDKEALAISDIWAGIKAIHDANKTLLDSNVSAKGVEAGAALVGKTEGDKTDTALVDYVAKFIKLPQLETKDGKVQFVKKDDAFVPAEIDKAMIDKYIELAFAQYPSDGQYADYINADLVRRISGKSYTAIINDGLYAYAKYVDGKGLAGSVGLRANKEDTTGYIELGGSIGFIDSGNSPLCAMPEDFEDCTKFDAVKDGMTDADKDKKGYRSIFDLTWKAFDAFLLDKAA